jgi:DNA-binding transcriptional MerR regulator
LTSTSTQPQSNHAGPLPNPPPPRPPASPHHRAARPPRRPPRNRVYTLRDRTRLKLTLRGKRLGLSLLEIKQLVDMYDSPADTAQQLQAFLAVLAQHRLQLEQQREDLDITLAEITQHEERCRSLLAGTAPKVGAGRTRRKAAA